MAKCSFTQPDGRTERYITVGTVIIFPDNFKITIRNITVVVDFHFSPLVYFDVEGGEQNRSMILKHLVEQIKEEEEVKKDENIKQ